MNIWKRQRTLMKTQTSPGCWHVRGEYFDFTLLSSWLCAGYKWFLKSVITGLLMKWFNGFSLLFRSPTMSSAFKGISTLQRINHDCSIFDSLNLKCFLHHGHVNVLINPVSGEIPIKEGYSCHQLIYFMSKSSFLQHEVEVSINKDICIYTGIL